MDKNFKRNLFVGFGASLIILIISSAASLFSIYNLLDSSGWVNHTHTVIIETNAIEAALMDAETGQRGFLLTGNRDFLEPYLDAKARAMASYAKVKTLTKDNIEQQTTLQELQSLIESRFTYLQGGIDARKKGVIIDQGFLERGNDAMRNTRSLLKLIEQRETALLSTRVESSDRFSSFTPPLITTAAIIALIITILFYARVRNDFNERLRLQQQLIRKDQDINNRITIIQSIADKVSNGDYEVRVEDKESDALGSVAGALNKMAGSLQSSFSTISDKAWLQTGISKLNEAMIGDQTVAVLSKKIIDFLATYTNSGLAAFYLLEKDELIAIAGYAYQPEASREKFKLGEGLVGQSVVNGKYMELKDVSEENFQLRLSVGHIKPQHIIALPIFDGYQIKGAIELASMSGFSPRDIEFLSTVVHNIGVGISSAENRKRLQDLLEETQTQSEELKTQHAELENLNSELEVQAEKLQASEEELKVQQEELKQANQELEERSRLLEDRNELITERNLEIQTKADQLTQSTRYKSEFLANMSHELRTPLNSILLLSKLLSENQEKNLSSDQVEYAAVIQNSGHGLLSLIDEILDLSKIEAGKMQLDFQWISLQQIISNMTGLFEPLAREKGIAFNIGIEENTPEKIETDPMRLEQILKNLLSNAMKFTAQGYVSLEVSGYENDKTFIQLQVKDTGIGIAKEKQQLVFEAFQQADGSTRRKYGGTGLGLSISRELAALLGGQITLRSEPEKGSVFTIILPISRVHEPGNLNDQETVVPLALAPVLKEAEQDPRYISTSIPENIPDDRTTVTKDDKVILIVEDDVAFGKSLLEFTRQRGYKGIVAVRGDEGIALAQQYIPLGILLDIRLPVKSGWQVMEELKSNPQTRHIPVHIMSSFEVKNESLIKGAVDFINKPFAFEKIPDIFQKIEQVLRNHPKKVLIVEENPKHAKALAYFLETFDVSIEINTGVDDAIQSLKNESINCVILDMGIPDQKAYDTLEEVKKTRGLENIPIIIFTGKSLSQTEEQRIKHYADSIVVKTAHSYKRILDEISLFLHLMEKNDATKQAPAAKWHKLGALDEVLKDKTVLVADDDMRNVFSLTKALERYQMKVIAAVDGKDALQKLNQHQDVDVVLMDMMMPEMDGYDSTRAIRKDPRFKNLPVIAVTAKAMMGDRVKCINAGASDYITKPVDIDQLLSLLRVWLYERSHK